MSVLNVYTLYDVKALAYNPPFFVNNHGMARRAVLDLVTDPNTTVGRHPSDFKLYCLGTYDQASGRFVLFEIAEHVIDAVALVPAKTPSMFDYPVGVTPDPEWFRKNGIFKQGEEAK